MHAKQQGFTLIELIVVIVILGILAATALPKFIDLSSDARAGVIRGVEGSMRAANTMVYGKAAAQNRLSGTTTLTGSGISGTLNITNGYATDASEFPKILDLSPPGDFNATAAAIQHTGAPTPGSCQVAYAAAPLNGVPTYTQTTGGC